MIEPEEDLTHTALYDLHVKNDGRMVGFGGYALPIQYKGIVAEHNHTRNSASLFDVSHMGQIIVRGKDFIDAATALETLMPADLLSLQPGEMRYTLLLNESGGIEDDLIVTRPADGQAADGTIFIVVNAATKHNDFSILQSALGDRLDIAFDEAKSLIALQGPKAKDVISRHCNIAQELIFMQAAAAMFGDIKCNISRAGYTGEDGFEISVSDKEATALAEILLNEPEVEFAGLGARDSLRLEAGLCLYGHDMNADIDPVSAGLLFAVGKRRRTEGGFTGAKKVLEILANGATKKRVGISFEGRMPVREGAAFVDGDGNEIGNVTSGSFSPILEAPIAMGYLPVERAKIGMPVCAIVRGREVFGEVVKMPFVANNYVRNL